MNAEELRALQAPLKDRYREQPATAVQVMRATGTLGGPGEILCRVETTAGAVEAGLHPAAGGDGSWACSGDMLLQSLVACAGVTLRAVATAMGIEIRGGTITAEADLDFRGTLGVSREVPVGLTAVRLSFRLDTDAPEESLTKLLGLTERYCVIYQTLKHPPTLTSAIERG